LCQRVKANVCCPAAPDDPTVEDRTFCVCEVCVYLMIAVALL
jgi:hypothetical protein